MTRPADVPLVHEAIATRAAADPDAVAVLTDGGTLTYGQLLEQATQVARAVREASGDRDQIVGLSCRRSVDGLIGLLGILLAGAAYTYLDTTWPPDRLRRVAAQCRMPILVTDAHAAGIAEDLGPATISLDRVLTARRGDPEPLVVNQPGDLAYVVYTSGSTGVPKGVAVEHGGVANMCRQLARVFKVAPGSRMLQFSHWAWDAAACEILVTLTAGGTLVLAPETVRHAGEDLAELLRRHRVNVATLTPSVLAALPHGDLPDLRTVVAVGEPCPTDLVTRWARQGRRVLNGYGPTEATVAVSVGSCRPGRTVTIGRPLPGVAVRILDDTGTAVPTGQPGQLLVGGVGVARGYLTDPENTDPALGPTVATAGPFFTDADGARWYRTGDVVRQRGDGSLIFEHRIDDQIQLHGHRIEPREVAHALRRHPRVQACAVMARAGRLVAFVLTDDPDLTAADMSSVAAQWLPPHMIPEVHLVERWPVNEYGKVDLAALTDAVHGGEPARMPMPAPSPLDSTVADVLELVRYVLENDAPGPDTDFFEAGGHSLLAAQLAVEVGQRFGVLVEARQITEGRTARRLAELIAQPALVGQGG